MKLSERHDYEAAPDRVWAMITDPAWREQVCAATGATRWDVTVDADESGGRVEVTRVLPAEVPDAVRRIIGETVTVTQTETWGAAKADGTRQGDVELQVKGQPATMKGSSRLAPSAGGTQLQMDGELKVRIPLIGGRLEKELVKAIKMALRKEQEVGRRWLA
jgi:hypothetical protein